MEKRGRRAIVNRLPVLNHASAVHAYDGVEFGVELHEMDR